MPDPVAAPPADPNAATPPPAPQPQGSTPPPADPNAPPPAPPQEPQFSWPDNWREGYAKTKQNGEKLLTRLQRYASPEAALDALISVQNKISAGELRTNVAFPTNGTPEQQAEWRKNAGVPDSPDKYEIKLPSGLVVGEEDKPIVDSFLKAAHSANLPPNQVNSLLNWYFKDVVEGQQSALFQRDEQIKQEVEDKLRAEWGNDFRRNKALIDAYLDSGPPGTKDLLLNARLADGTPLASHVDVLRFLADKAREFNPVISLVPGDASATVKTITDELTQIQSLMSNKQSEYWKGPKSQQLQARYRELIDARDRMASRQKAA